jgi:cell pole-organizing protein PopZ
MNKPAPKEPSMDEILSSIRQIIADDDAAATTAPRRQSFQPVVASANPEPASAADVPEIAAEDDEPLALSAEQIIEEPVEEAAAEVEADAATLVDPNDVTFEPDPETDTVEEDSEVSAMSVEVDESEAEPEVATAAPEFMPFEAAATEEPAMPRRSVAETAPMPDPTLSSDLADKLLEPTTDAAVRHTFSRITHMPVGNEGLTIEALMRDMLRPMLKEWLDENLPTVVERMVEKEIARVSRGLE